MKKALSILALGILMAFVFMTTGTKVYAQTPPQKTINLITATFGSTAYLIAQQLATEVNKKHPWLRINVIEGKPNNAHELANKPNIRSNTVVESATYTKWAVSKGLRPAKAPYHGARALCAMAGILAVPIFTNDENIKSLQDLKGKRVNLFTKGTQGENTLTALLKHIGILDTIKADYLPFKPGVDAIIDGLIQATVGYAALVQNEPIKYSPVSAYIEMLESRKCDVIDIPLQLMREASKATGIPISPIKLPAGSIAKGVPSKDMTTYCTYIWMFVDENFPEDLAYEVCKVYAENLQALRKTSPGASALAIEKLAMSDLKPEEYHPGALRFFKEKGIKVITE
ncbi:MAG: TAXI family TRAP transporter solute-binding subunit [Deltaproteobacteria bacterium]|nr:TAXI family TRAP transporter solute-binding subunit [Deltaproteobacteria bacterium]